MRVLVACEESQKVCKAFRERGHEAYSNDLLQCSGGHPEWHILMDCIEAICYRRWDLIIMHPDCTKVAVSGNGTYGIGKPKHNERILSAKWIGELWQIATSECDRVAMENPVGVLNSIIEYLPKPQYVDLWWFGEPEMKKTAIWLHGLPELVPTNNVYDYMMTLPVKERQKVWYESPGPDRKRKRAETRTGIAKAMAEQWG